MYKRQEVWGSTGTSPTVFRYVDWIVTVPLQMVEFYLILAAVTAVSMGVFWRLLIGTVVMVVAGYMGEAGFINTTIGFVVGMAGWAYILYEIFSGEASKSAANAKPSVQSAFQYNEMDCYYRLGDLSFRVFSRIFSWWY